MEENNAMIITDKNIISGKVAEALSKRGYISIDEKDYEQAANGATEMVAVEVGSNDWMTFISALKTEGKDAVTAGSSVIIWITGARDLTMEQLSEINDAIREFPTKAVKRGLSYSEGDENRALILVCKK